MKLTVKIFLSLYFTFIASVHAQDTVVFIQLNDVYEIAPLENGKYGGLARVASVVRDYESKYKCYVVLAGDFISPSAIGTSEFDGKRINGRQMVDVLNSIGLDFVTFGNHEFDYSYEVLQDRINESKFDWIVSNVNHIQDGAVQSFRKKERDLPQYAILRILLPNSSKEIKLGLFGLCIGANKQPYVSYEDQCETANRVYGMIKDSIDYLLALTHLTIDDDKELAKRVPEIKLIMGGHEHNNMYHKVGGTIIAKADANARTVYIHKLLFNEAGNLNVIQSDLVFIDSSFIENDSVKSIVDTWVDRAYKGFYDRGFDAKQLVIDLGSESLDGREQTVRNGLSALGYLIALSMLQASPGADGAIFNSGAIRIDDELKGEVTQYDIIRVLPFGGEILQVEIKGSLLKQVLETGWNNKGNGGFLQFAGIEYTVNGFKTKGGIIKDGKTYNIAVLDFLLTGMEQNMGFLTKDNPGIVKITKPDPSNKNDLRNDIRFAVIEYLRKWSKNQK